MAGSPLIISGKAARRLRLLQLPPSPPRPAAAAAAAAGAAATVASGLPAALLEEPAPAGDASGSWLADRDVLYEVAATVRTLQELQIPSGALVLVAAVGRPEVPPHLARLLALTHPPRGASPRDGGGGPTGAEPADGVAYLAPSLAHNLGLALHLTPLLLLDGGDGTRDSAGSPGRAPLDRVLIQRYAGVTSQEEQQQQGQQQQGQQQRLAQPGSEAVLVPVAGEADFAVVRTPAPALLQQRPQTGAAEGAAAREPGQPPASAGSGDGAGSGPAAALASTDGGGDPTAGGGAAPPAASDDAAAALQQWLLAARRVVQLGDVVAVPRPPPSGTGPLLPLALPNLSVPPALANPAAGAASAPLELIYFRVVRLVVPGEAGAAAAGAAAAAAVDVRGTTVKLAGSCCSGLPVGLPHYLAAAACGDSAMLCRSRRVLGACAAAAEAPLAVLPPAGLLLPAWRQVAQLLATVLHPAAAALPLHLAILLHGPPGSGKRTAAAAAAAAAGCHLVSLSAHDVKAAAGAAERHTFEGLRAAFSAAADYRPALLLLEDVAALGDGSSHGGSGSSSAQSYAARLGSVLADCIRAHGGAAADPGNAGSAGGRGSTGVAAPAGSAASGLFPAPVVLLGCAAAADDLPAPLRRCFTHELAVEAPDQAQRSQLLASFLAGAPTAPDLAGQGAPASEDGHASDVQRGSGGLEEAARHTAGLLPRELRAVAADAAAAAALQALPPAAVLRALDGRGAANGASTPTLDPPQAAPSEGAPALAQRHLSAAIEAVRQRTATDIGAPRIPSVRWEDVGGLQDVKRAILDTVELPLKHPELFAGGLRRRSGVLLYGPPGTGKTLLAKAVATECATSFLSVKGPELINQYVGESERQIREVFARARRARPCVVFFDELDSLAPARGRGSDSGGVMDRLVSQLLAEIDGVQGSGASGDVFVVGATNRPDLLDPALLRPGRLDRLLYVGIAADVPSRLQVLQALTRRFNLAPGVDLGEVAARCADRFTGADLYALCADAWMTALKRSIAHLERQQQQPEQQQQEASGEAAAGDDRGWDGDPGGGGEGEEEEVVVTQEDLLAAAASLQPSLSAEEVARYERIRDQYNSKG